MNTTTIAFQFDLSNPTHLQFFGQLASSGIPFQMLNTTANVNIGTSVANTPVNTPVTTEKKPYVATKDFQCKFEIKEQTSKDGQKLFCISRSNGWTKAEKALANNAIKAIKGIKEIEVEYTKDGKTRTFKAWGFSQKATAQKHLATLPTVITVEQLNSYGK